MAFLPQMGESDTQVKSLLNQRPVKLLAGIAVLEININVFFHGDVYIVSTFCLIGVCYVRCLKGAGGVNPLSNCQFQVSLCNTKYKMSCWISYRIIV